MTKLLAIVAVAVCTAAGVFLFVGGEPQPQVETIVVERGDVAAELVTNGRIEAGKRYDVRAETQGVVERTAVEPGDSVRRGMILARIGAATARAAAEQADARVEAARAALAAAEGGLSPAERTDAESRLALAKQTLESLRSEAETVERLVARAAAPRAELEALRQRIAETDSEADRLRAKLAARPAQNQVEQARATLREAEAAARQAVVALASTEVRAPADGKVYSLGVRPGDYVDRGDLIARIAGEGPLEARVFVDEPELGRIRLGAAARLTADAYPGSEWTCRIERRPTEIVELGNRRVGEVRCTVEGEAEQLIPNLTVNVVVASDVARNALVVPREAVRRDSEGDYVVLADGSRRTVEIGVRGPERVEVSSGLSEGDAVLLRNGGER